MLMPYIIDGHNLIGALPDIDLAEEHDEDKLILRLRGLAARLGKKIIVVFDEGLPGGKDRARTNKSVEVVFASSKRSTADKVIMERIRNTRDGHNWTVVSSDREVQAVAKQKKMRILTSQQMVKEMQKKSHHTKKDPSEAVHPQISAQEVEEFEQIFSQKMSSDLKKKRKR
jgi:predicted RNA-binding protein with PIN domain